MSNSIARSRTRPLKLFASAATTALLIGLMAGAAQAANPTQQAALPPLPQASAPAPVPLGHEDVREMQNQLIALGFEPGPADGQIGPATVAAAQQYDQRHGGNGQVSIDSAFLARLKADTGPRLSYEQVAERSRAAHYQSQSQSQPQPQVQAQTSSASSAQLGGIVQQIVPLIGAAIANSNNNNNYGPGYYNQGSYYGSGPSYYGPPPGYYNRGYGYGGF